MAVDIGKDNPESEVTTLKLRDASVSMISEEDKSILRSGEENSDWEPEFERSTMAQDDAEDDVTELKDEATNGLKRWLAKTWSDWRHWNYVKSSETARRGGDPKEQSGYGIEVANHLGAGLGALFGRRWLVALGFAE